MATYDLAVSIDQTTLNSQLSTLFGLSQLQTVLWTQNVNQSLQDSPATGSWTVKQAPTISLTEPTQNQWSDAIGSDGSAPAQVTPAAIVSFPEFYADITWSGATLQSTFQMGVICEASIANNDLTVTALGVLVDLSGLSSDDQTIVQYIIIPAILAQVNAMLASIALPQLDFEGVDFGSPVLAQFSDRLVLVAALSGSPDPTVPAETDLPSDPLFVLASPAALQAAANANIAQLSGQTFSDSGTSPVQWSASLTINSPSITVGTSDPTTAAVSFQPGITTNATVDAGPCAIGSAFST